MATSPETDRQAGPGTRPPSARDRSTIAARSLRRDRSGLAAHLAIFALIGSQFNYPLMCVLFPGSDERYESVSISPEFIVGSVFLVMSLLLWIREGGPLLARRKLDMAKAMLLLTSTCMIASVIHNQVSLRYVVTIFTCLSYFLSARFLAAFYLPRFASGLKNLWLWITPAFLGILGYLYLDGRVLYTMSTASGMPQPYIDGGIRPSEVALYLSLQIIYLIYCLYINRSKAKRVVMLGFLAVLILLLLWMQSVSAVVGMAAVVGGYLWFVGRCRRLTTGLLLFGVLVVVGVLLFNPSRGKPFLDRIDDMVSVKRSEFSGGDGKRAVMFSTLIGLARENPVFGIGMGRFAERSYITEYSGKGLNPHNDVLGIAAEEGFPAATFYLIYVLCVLSVGIAPFMTRRASHILSGDGVILQFHFMVLACFAFCQWRGLVHNTGGFKEVYFWAGIVIGAGIWRTKSAGTSPCQDLPAQRDHQANCA